MMSKGLLYQNIELIFHCIHVEVDLTILYIVSVCEFLAVQYEYYKNRRRSIDNKTVHEMMTIEQITVFLCV